MWETPVQLKDDPFAIEVSGDGVLIQLPESKQAISCAVEDLPKLARVCAQVLERLSEPTCVLLRCEIPEVKPDLHEGVEVEAIEQSGDDMYCVTVITSERKRHSRGVALPEALRNLADLIEKDENDTGIAY